MVDPGTTASAFKSHFILNGNASVVLSDDSGILWENDSIPNRKNDVILNG